MHAWKTEKTKKEMKTSAVLLLVAWNFFLLHYPSGKHAISASQTVTSSVNNCFMDFFKKININATELAGAIKLSSGMW